MIDKNNYTILQRRFSSEEPQGEQIKVRGKELR